MRKVAHRLAVLVGLIAVVALLVSVPATASSPDRHCQKYKKNTPRYKACAKASRHSPP